MRKRVLSFLFHHHLKFIIPIFHLLVSGNRLRLGKETIINFTSANVYKTVIDLKSGVQNNIFVGEGSDLHNSRITIKGNKNRVCIGENAFVNGLNLIIEGEGNVVDIGDGAFILDDTRMYVVDGSLLSIGNGCMFSDHIEIRTTDNHSILDMHTEERINYEKNVVFHDDVWIGTRTIILKGSEIAEGCIVGAGSLVTGKHAKPHCILAGNPAREIKENVSWRMERIRRA